MKRTYLVLIITMLVIGFAAVATNLAINGTINFGFNSNNFNDSVVFTYTNTMNGTAKIAENGKSITFKTTKLEDVGQKAIMDFDIANKSSQYDANVTIECGLESGFETYKDYIDIKHDLGDSAFKINAGETKSGRLTITLKKAYNESLETDIDMLCTIKATPEERDIEGTYTPKEHEYKEILLNGADPVLEVSSVEAVSLEADESNKQLIPVTISEVDGTVTRADTTKQWYDYETKQWANAVILVDGVEDPGVNKPILENQIESYFVWIPKFKYKLWNVNQKSEYTNSKIPNDPKTIELEFGLEDTENNQGESCKTPLNSAGTQALSGNIGDCDNGEWMTHPAFMTMGVPGFWVGKFETGYKDALTSEEAQTDEAVSSNVVVKPNVYSWRAISISNMIEVSFNYSRNLDSHLMKNTEWGAAAYLSHSKYGINNEVAINNYSLYKTGYATSPNVDQNKYPGSEGGEKDTKLYDTELYNSEYGYKASTSGNITGIYDMSGGAWDRVASYKAGLSDINITHEDKYFDSYNIDSTGTTYEFMILGDATGEMGPFQLYTESDNTNYYHNNWYSDYSSFVDSGGQWFIRGGMYSYGTLAGIFSFHRSTKQTHNNVSFRIVLSPQ